MSDVEFAESYGLAVFILDGKECTFEQAFKKLLGKDKNVPQSRRDLYGYLMAYCRKPKHDILFDDIRPHLEAARKEDGK